MSIIGGLIIGIGISNKKRKLGERSENGDLLAARDLAFLHMEDKNFDDALFQINKYLTQNQKDEDALCIAGACYMRKKNFEDASDIFHRLIEINPKNADNNFALGSCYYLLGNIEKAKEYQEIAVSINKKYRKQRFVKD